MPDWIGLFLEEDLGGDPAVSRDVTTAALMPEAEGRARIVARERCFVAGLARAAEVFGRLGASARPLVPDGSWQAAGTALMEVGGPAAAILVAERTALNLLARMSGVATRTRPLVEALEASGLRARVAATRKTTPGLRAFEKEAVVLAGGDPHRMGLFDAAMVKDNHRAAAGDVAEAVRRIRARTPQVPITVEAESLDDALAAARAGADWILIDNQDPATGKAWADVLRKEVPGVLVEASGGITDPVPYGWADRVSLGRLTQDVTCPDLGLDWDGPDDASDPHASQDERREADGAEAS